MNYENSKTKISIETLSSVWDIQIFPQIFAEDAFLLFEIEEQ
jgi:hypothetical protein